MKKKLKKFLEKYNLYETAIDIDKKISASLYKSTVKYGGGFNIQKHFLPNDILVYINPQNINYVVNSNFKGSFGLLQKDNLDESVSPLKSNTDNNPRLYIYNTIRQIFEEKKPYTESDQYKYMKIKMEEGAYDKSYWCTTLEEIDDYFEVLIKSYESIKNDGYKSQDEIKDKTLISNKDLKDEIQVFVGAKGELILGNRGTHRTLIADSLKIEEVPAIINGVHFDYAKKCYDKHQLDILSSIKKELKDQDILY